MNEVTTTCAASDVRLEWHQIDWSKANQNVKKMQARIVKATQEGRWNKVKSLQWLLTHSFSGKALAVKRVSENNGKNTPGVDGKTWSTPKSKTKAILSLKRHGYKTSPLRRVMIPKKNGKLRPLGIPTMKDRAMQALYLLALLPVAETTADHNSYGFRPCRSTADAREQGFKDLSQKWSAQWILECDIKGCFDNINHNWLMKNVITDKVILQKWLKAGFVYEKELFPTEKGTPQGGVISPTLANITLDGLEGMLEKAFGYRKDKPNVTVKSKNQVNLVRYADDFIITGRTEELLEKEVKPKVEEFLKTRGLELEKTKTKITHIDEGFDFLGWNFRKWNGKVITKPAMKNVTEVLKKIRGIIKDNKTAKQENLIGLLNPIIRGWTEYHKGVVAKATFKKIDNELWNALWKWAKRRHTSRSSAWIIKKYWSGEKNRTYSFRNKEKVLIKAADTRIVRHIKIKGDTNPFDPKQAEYIKKRKEQNMLKSLNGNDYLTRIWKKQAGICPECQQEFEQENHWHIHHIVPRKDGGGNEMVNVQMLHTTCHRKLHNRC